MGRLNWNNFRSPTGTGFYRYVIPKELMVFNDVDDLYRTRMKDVLDYYCHLTLQEYFDLIVLHINDTNERSKCKYCSQPIEFSGELARGYARHKWELTYNLFCSPSCRQYYIHQHSDEYPSEVIRRKIFSEKVVGSIKVQAKASLSRMLSYGDYSDLIYFYTGSTGGSLKYGVTVDYWSRNNHLHLDNLEVYELPRATASLLEYLIKLEFINLGLEDHEFIDIKYLIKFNETISRNLKLVNNLTFDEITIIVNEI